MARKLLAFAGLGLALVVLTVSVIQHRHLLVDPDVPAAGAGFGGAPTSRPAAGDATLRQFDLTGLTIPRDEIMRGGPPKDGIPAITDPDVVAVDQADFLRPGDRVVGVTLNGEARAYSIRLLNWHEVVNDELAGVPFAVVYCPLCDSASVFDRRIGDETLEFGVSGLLYNSNVLLYDRTHDALWSQILFAAVSGPYAGQELDHLPWDLTTFAQWKRDHPGSTVATFNTGHMRAYDRNPYEQYFRQDGLMFPAKGGDDDRLPEKEPVVGVVVGELARAYPVARVAAADGGRLVDELGPGQVVLEARDGGQVRVVAKPQGAQTVHTFWFAWVAFHPQTDVFDQP